MKKLLMLPIFAALFSLTGCGGVDVIDYNDKLVELAETCFTAENLMWDAVDQENYTLANELLSSSIETCQKTQTDTAAMEGYNDDTDLRDAVDALLQAEVAYLTKFQEALPYRELDEMSDEENANYEAIEAELDILDEASVAASNNLVSIQEAFSTKHGYELEE
ncbi:MAG: hypothetical protein LBH96_06550 [Candidatus Peribacteria bacterium]|jgi:chemotaxis protein histidine kinase CheA|nr:hypothetical protein [Candidatus Peribacteria bacterium]